VKHFLTAALIATALASPVKGDTVQINCTHKLELNTLVSVTTDFYEINLEDRSVYFLGSASGPDQSTPDSDIMAGPRDVVIWTEEHIGFVFPFGYPLVGINSRLLNRSTGKMISVNVSTDNFPSSDVFMLSDDNAEIDGAVYDCWRPI